MNPKTEQLRQRTHRFFMRVIALCGSLPGCPAACSISGQLLDSSGSTDSNYRAACRARSRKEFIAKLGVVIEEADESMGWLESLRDRKLGDLDELRALIKEADELIAIFVASRKTAEANEQEAERCRAAAKAATRHRR